jgi:hypothetical protein
MCIRLTPALARILVVFAAIIVFVGIGATNNPSITFVASAVAAAAVERPRYYTRREAVEYLRSRGFPITASTMTKKCALGLGPRAAARWSQRHLYLAEDLDAWAESFIQPLPANSPTAPPAKGAFRTPPCGSPPPAAPAPLAAAE